MTSSALVATLATALLALSAWRISINAIRAAYRPLLRPVKTTGVTTFLVKNYGNGPAIGVLVYAPGDPEPIAEVDVVEPIGEPIGESKEANRVGRQTIVLRSGTTVRDNTEYRILYQDLAGVFHESTFALVEGRPRVEYFGPLSPLRALWKGRPIPKNARQRRQVVRDVEEL